MKDNPSTKTPEECASDHSNAPTPSEVLALIRGSLKHYMTSPQERPKWTDEGMVVLTLIIALAAFVSAWFVWKQLRLTAESFRIDGRAWVEIEPVEPIAKPPIPNMFGNSTPKLTAAFRYDVYPKNVGKTAAYDVVVRGYETHANGEWGNNAQAISSLQDKRMLGKYTEVETGQLVPFPNTPMPKVLGPSTKTPVPFPVSGQGPSTFPDGTVFLSYFVGRIDYVDAFQISHWIKFCFFVADSYGNTRNCQEGNDEDRNPEN